MLYLLLKYLSQHFDVPGIGMFMSLSFRASMGVILALAIGMIFGRRIIRLLQRHQIGEEVRNLGLEGQLQKRGTPTMGGLIILAAILIPILLFGDLTNVYVWLMIISTVWLGLIGFLDDYIKVFRKNKDGLKGRFKVVGQVGLGIIVGCVMWMSPDIVIKEKQATRAEETHLEYVENNGARNAVYMGPAQKSNKTTIPFIKDNEFDYRWLVPGDGPTSEKTQLDRVCAGGHSGHYGGLQRGEPDRRIGRVGLGGFGLYRDRTGGVGLPVGERHLCRLPQYHVYSHQRRTGGVCDHLCRGPDRVSVVQLLSRAGLYGRYGIVGHRGDHRGVCAADPQGVVVADPLRDFLCGKPVGDYSGDLF